LEPEEYGNPDPEQHRLVHLNLIEDGINSVEEIAENLAREYRIDLEIAMRDTIEIIDELLRAGVIWKEG